MEGLFCGYSVSDDRSLEGRRCIFTGLSISLEVGPSFPHACGASALCWLHTLPLFSLCVVLGLNFMRLQEAKREADWFRIGFEPIFVDLSKLGCFYLIFLLVKVGVPTLLPSIYRHQP